MKIPRPKLVVAAVVGAVLVVGLIAAGTDNIDLALICILLVQSIALVGVADTRRRQGGLSDAVAKNATAFERVDRAIGNVSVRVVTEARATENEVVRNFRVHFRDLIAKPAYRTDRLADYPMQDGRAQPRSVDARLSVELLGPSGVGKSTILSAAESLRGDPPAWLGSAEIAELTKPMTDAGGRMFRRRALDGLALQEFVETCFEIVNELPIAPSRRLSCLKMVQQAAVMSHAAALIEGTSPLVQEELLLHRAFSILPQSRNLERDATAYFTLAPIPGAAVVLTADADTLLARIAERGTTPNCYASLDAEGLRGAVDNALKAGEIAVEVLRDRGVRVLALDASGPAEDSAQQLHHFVLAHLEGKP